MKMPVLFAMMSFAVFAKTQEKLQEIAQSKLDFEQCQVAKEFVTALEFLRAQTVYAIPEEQARKVAENVSTGCTGAASRFINSTQLLVAAGVDTKTAIETGIKLANSDDNHVENFQHFFKRSFAEEYLDLPINISLDIAVKLSHDFHGNPKIAKDDFDKLVSFCMDKKKLDLPVALCAETAANITKLGDQFKTAIAPSFFKLYDFLTDSKGAARPVMDAFKLSEEVLKNGPVGVDNFIYAYKFATSKKGLDLDDSKSTTFAKNISDKTVKKN